MVRTRAQQRAAAAAAQQVESIEEAATDDSEVEIENTEQHGTTEDESIKTLKQPKSTKQPRKVSKKNKTDNANLKKESTQNRTQGAKSKSGNNAEVFGKVMGMIVALIAMYLMANPNSNGGDIVRSGTRNNSLSMRRKEALEFERQLGKVVRANSKLNNSLSKSYETDLYSPLEALTEFGEQVLEGSWLPEEQDSVASIQLAGDHPEYTSDVLEIVKSVFKSVSPSIAIASFDVASEKPGSLLPSLAKFLKGSQTDIPHLFIVENCHQRVSEVMQLKDNLERSSILLDERTGTNFPISGVGILLVSTPTSTDLCPAKSIDTHDEKDLGWHRSFISRIGLKARICSV